MKIDDKADETFGPTRVALLLGLSVGLGIVVHEGFFLVAGAIAVGSLIVAGAHAMQEHAGTGRLTHQDR